jgi:hypothetical protein
LYFGITGIVNFIGALLVCIFIVGSTGADFFVAFSWLFMSIVHFAAWITMIVLWIMSSGDEKYEGIIWFVDIALYVKYATVYGGYGLLFLLLLISGVSNSTALPFDSTNGAIYACLYLLVVGINIFVQLFFEPDLEKWKKFAEY